VTSGGEASLRHINGGRRKGRNLRASSGVAFYGRPRLGGGAKTSSRGVGHGSPAAPSLWRAEVGATARTRATSQRVDGVRGADKGGEGTEGAGWFRASQRRLWAQRRQNVAWHGCRGRTRSAQQRACATCLAPGARSHALERAKAEVGGGQHLFY
jgi:hypothetical protein